MDSTTSLLSRFSLGSQLPQSGAGTVQPDDEQTSYRNGIFPFSKFAEECLQSGLDIIDEHQFERRQFLGSGQTMAVFEGYWKTKSLAVAVKYLNRSYSHDKAIAASQRHDLEAIVQSAALEIRVLRHVSVRRHRNVADILAVSWEFDNDAVGSPALYPILIMELADLQYPTLTALVNSDRFPLTLAKKLALLQDVVEALILLHDLAIVHGDLKPDNILIFKNDSLDLVAKISDFGFSQPDAQSRGAQFEAGGTEYWNAPECLKGAPDEIRPSARSYPRDMYAFALVSCFVLLEELPFAQQGWSIEETTTIKLKNKLPRILGSRWRYQEKDSVFTSGEWLDLVEDPIENMDESALNWKVRRQQGWCTEEQLPIFFMRSIPNMLALTPNVRPKAEEVGNILRKSTGRAPPKLDEGHTLTSRNGINIPLKVSVTGKSSMMHPLYRLPLSSDLKNCMHRTFLVAARDTSISRRIDAMLNLGISAIEGFGTEVDLSQAIQWFGRAGLQGSLQGQEMVFRMEKALKLNATAVVFTLTASLRAHWIVNCLLRDLGPKQLKNELPPGLQIDQPDEKLKDVLLNLDPHIVESGMQREVDLNIIRLNGLRAAKEDKLSILKDHPLLCRAIQENNPKKLQSILSSRYKILPQDLREAIIRSSADNRALDILQTIVGELNFDVHDQGFKLALYESVLKSDENVVHTLLHLGVPAVPLMASNAVDLIIRGCTVPTIELVLSLFDMIKVEDATLDSKSYYEPQVALRQILDGIVPFMGLGTAQSGPPVDTRNPPIFYCVTRSRHLNLWLILALGGNPNVRYMGMTALHLAVKMLKPFFVGILLAFGADPNARDWTSNYETPLHILSNSNIRTKVDDDMYFRYLDIFGQKFSEAPPSAEDDNHCRELIVKLLIKYGANVDALSGLGFTPLMTAIVSPQPYGQLLSRLMIENGANVTAPNLHGTTALHGLAYVGSVQLLQHVLYLPGSTGIEPVTRDGKTPLMMACTKADRLRHIKVLLDAGANVAARTDAGITPLITTMHSCQRESFDLLLSFIKQLPARMREAALADDPQTGRTILASAFECDDQTMTLHFIKELWTVVHYPHKCDRWGVTPLHLTMLRKNLEIAGFLLTKGASINAVENDGLTPLHLAYELQEPQMINYLVTRGANSLAKSRTGLTPEAYARNNIPGAYGQRIMQRLATITDNSKGQTYGESEFAHIQQLRSEAETITNDRFTAKTGSPHANSTEIEVAYLEVFEKSVQKLGSRHFESLWKMNNLGCVYERYGRWSKAERLFRNGWSLARTSLGQKHVLTQDFANKLLRVLSDCGLKAQRKEVSAWITKFGADTLEAPIMKTVQFTDREEFDSLPATELLAGVDLDTTSTAQASGEPCDRLHCKKPVKITCKECRVYAFCSMSCRDLDWEDKQGYHKDQCLQSLLPEQNTAILTQILKGYEGVGQKLSDFALDRILRGSRLRLQDLEKMPVVEQVQLVRCDLQKFTNTTRFRASKDTVVMFLSNGGFRYQMKNIQQTKGWQKPSALSVFLSYGNIDFWVSRDLASAEKNRTRMIEDETPFTTELFVLIKYRDLHLPIPK